MIRAGVRVGARGGGGGGASPGPAAWRRSIHSLAGADSNSLYCEERRQRRLLRQGRVLRDGIQWWTGSYGGKQQQQRGMLTESHACGPISPPLLTQTIPEHFSSVVSQHGDRNAVISRSQNEALTYRGLDERSDQLARGLRERGVKKGHRVAVSLGNCTESAVISYGVWKLGGIVVPLNPAFNSTQVIAALAHLETEHLIIGTETFLPYNKSRENMTLLRQLIPHLEGANVESESVPRLKNVFLVKNTNSISVNNYRALTPFEDLFSTSNAGGKLVPASKLDIHDIINIQFTSGTTSMPKAACLSHHNILNNGYSIGERMGLRTDDIVCCPPPLFHCFGCILGYMATATHGSAILFPTPAFDPEATLRSVQEYKATALYGVATMFVSELELLANKTVPCEGFQYLRTGIAAGSSVPSHLMEKLHKILNLTGLTICYGMTETSPVSCMTTPDDPIQKRIDSVGRLLPHVEAKIVSTAQKNQIVPIGEKGELVVSGYLVMKGYWNDAARTSEVRVVEKVLDPDAEGGVREKVWMHTGDEAEMDAEGYVKITGRIKDLIIRGGENIHPLEVENVLFMMDEVSEASVVGLPDSKYGEVVAAFIVPHSNIVTGVDDAGKGDEKRDECGYSQEGGSLTKEEIRDWVREKLSGHLVPKYVFWVKEYPKTASGKIQKFKLRDMGIQMLKGRETRV